MCTSGTFVGATQVAWRSALRVPAAQRNLTRMQLVGMYWVVSMAMPVKVVYTHVLTFICLVMTFQLGVGYTFLLTSTWLLPQAIVCVFFCPELPVSWKVNFVINLIPGLILEIITHLVAQVRFFAHPSPAVQETITCFLACLFQRSWINKFGMKWNDGWMFWYVV